MNDIVAYFMLLGGVSTAPVMPFWSNANQFGIYPESNGILATAGISKPFDASKAFDYRFGASMAVCTDGMTATGPVQCTPMIDELYASIHWKHLVLDVGQRHPDLDYYGADSFLGSLSATGGHLTETGNARSIPGICFSVTPWAVPGTRDHLWFWGSIGEYLTLDDRYVQRAGIHRLKFFTSVHFAKRWSITLGIDHYALFGGMHPENPAYNFTFVDWLRVICGLSGSSGASENDKMNALGDHGGSEIIRLDYDADEWHISFMHEIPYADKSGMYFKNFPDGVNTLSFSFKDKDKWVTDVLYEFYYTMYQSGSQHDPEVDEHGNPIPWEPGRNYIGMDNYYNNGEYRSGWTHYGRMITSPLFYPKGTKDHSWSRSTITYGTENNRIMAHHIGMGGKFFRKMPYRLMLTYSQNFGTYEQNYAGESPAQKPWGSVKETPLHQVSIGLTGEIPTLGKVKGLTLMYGLYGDIGQVLYDNFGVTLGLRYTLCK